MIPGNFLTPGPHWGDLDQALHAIEAETSLRTATVDVNIAPSGRRIDVLPDTFAPELRVACMEASRRIRLERRIAFERRVVLECASAELAVEPIARRGTRLHVPFLFRTARGGEDVRVRGELLLDGSDPLPALITEGMSGFVAHLAWAHMLLGFAELTCNGPEPSVLGTPAQHRRSRQSGRDRDKSIRIPQLWSESLEPTGIWYGLGGTYVAAHVSRLPADRKHRTEAEQLARQVGISLKQHETWVRDYIRGVPKNMEIRFRWRTPMVLATDIAACSDFP
jgi:hypothetical protein